MWWLVGLVSYAGVAAAFYAALVAKAQPEPGEAGEMPRLLAKAQPEPGEAGEMPRLCTDARRKAA